MNISFIGFGSMAKAIAKGLVKTNSHLISAAAPSLGVSITKDQIQTHYDNKVVIKNAEIIILAVKPNKMDEVLKEIGPEISTSTLLISVAAGLSTDWFGTRINTKHPLIRTMPNTPASVGLGATPMIGNKYVTNKHRHWAEAIFSTIGLSHWITQEEQMDTFTALSGSGPAYVFLFLESLVDAAVDLGLERHVAKEFALQTCKGAISLAENSNFCLSELRTQVTSPGGTTAAALGILQGRLEHLIHNAMCAAKNRAQELGMAFK